MKILFFYFVILCCIGFLFMGIDKYQAKHHGWRISEKTLLGIAFCGGALGSFLGMLFFRHKTKHSKFRFCLPLFTVLQVLLLFFYLYGESGFTMINLWI